MAQLWREESTPSFGGPHGLWGFESSALTGDGSGGQATYKIIAPLRGLYVVDSWHVETNTDAEGIRILMDFPGKQTEDPQVRDSGATSLMAAIGQGYGLSRSPARMFVVVKQANFSIVQFQRGNTNSEVMVASAAGRFWDLALIRQRQVPINWPT